MVRNEFNSNYIIGHDTSVQQLTQKEPAGIEPDGVVTQKLLFVVWLCQQVTLQGD